MNPVSFYFCFSADECLQHVVAEVNNTPWGEQHCYLLDPVHFCPQDENARELTRKEFHVSPFLPMDMTYRWDIRLNEGSLNIGIKNYTGDQKMLSVAMHLKKQELNAKNLNRVLWRYPFMTASVFLNIYWQAFILWWKKTPFFPHPGRSSRGDVKLASIQESSKESA